MRRHAAVGVKPALRVDQFHLRERFGIAMGIHERQVGFGEFLFDDDGIVLGPAVKAVHPLEQVVIFHAQALGDRFQVLGLEQLAVQNQAVGGTVVYDHAAVPIQDLAAGRQNGQRLNAVPKRRLAVILRIPDLKVPETRYQENKYCDSQILEQRNFARGKLYVVP